MSTMNAFFGQYGGQYVPAELIPALNQLETEFCKAQKDPDFRKELKSLLCDYAGRPTPLTPCRNLTRGTKTKIYLKREDLLHGGAHKTNQVLGQALLAKRMGKTRIIAETGAGQHGVATALACSKNSVALSNAVVAAFMVLTAWPILSNSAFKSSARLFRESAV